MYSIADGQLIVVILYGTLFCAPIVITGCNNNEPL